MRVKFSNGSLNAHMIDGTELELGDLFTYKVAARVAGNGYWFAARGDPTWSDEKVIDEGDVIDEKTAKALFSTLGNNLIYFADA